MKKITRFIASLVTLTSLSLVPMAVHAQASDPIVVGDSAVTSTQATTPAATTTPSTPNTGIAPSQNKALLRSLVFIGGSALGAAVAFGGIKLRNKQSS